MFLKIVKSILSRGTEVFLSVALVLVCFLAILFLLGLSFPLGTGLGDLLSGDDRSFLERKRSGEFGFTLSGEREGPPTIAHLSRTYNTVKDRPVHAISWSSSRQGMELQDGHAVQTFHGSGATISFDKGSDLKLGPDALVVLKRFARDRFGNARRASLVVLDGELRARIGQAGRGPMDLEIVTPSGTTTVRSASAPNGRADLRVAANPDGSSTFTVFEGVGEVSARGRTVTVRPDHSVTVPRAGLPSGPVRLPSAPVVTAPPEDAAYHYRSVPPKIRFAWNAEDESDSYRLMIARDPEFLDLVYDKRMPDSELNHGNLKKGQYYWRVSGMAGWSESAPGPPRRLGVVLDSEPPDLHVSFPEETVFGNRFSLRGSVEPGSEVFIGNEPVPTNATGEFEYDLALRRGLSVVVVEAVDTAGNTAYRSQLVNAKY
jgi:hypothetical protein